MIIIMYFNLCTFNTKEKWHYPLKSNINSVIRYTKDYYGVGGGSIMLTMFFFTEFYRIFLNVDF